MESGMMGKNRLMRCCNVIMCLIVLSSVEVVLINSASSQRNNNNSNNTSLLVSSFSYPETKLKPFEWRYIRVELPTWFSSMDITLVSNANIGIDDLEKYGSKIMVPMICFRDGSFPLPDVSETAVKSLVLEIPSSGSSGRVQNSQVVDQCFSFPKNITMTLTNEQISPGVWYIGFFNGIGPARTQSKMISRGPAYTFSVDIRVKGCTTSTIWGPFCNQSISFLSCTDSDMQGHPRRLLNMDMYNRRVGLLYEPISRVTQSDLKKEPTVNPSTPMIAENVITCNNLDQDACLVNNDIKVYFLEMLDMALEFKIMANAVRLNQTSASNTTGNVSEMLIKCYVRHNAMPLSTSHDYSGEISKDPLVIPSPKVGRWYIAIHVLNRTKVNGTTLQDKNMQAVICFSLELQVRECPPGKAGQNCTWERHMLQRYLRKNPSLPFESYYLPSGGKYSSKSASFPLEPLMSNISLEDKSDVLWTYFLLDVPRGAAGANIHIQLTSNAKISYGIYARYGGLPSLHIWDYYVNSTSSSNGSMFLSFNDSSGGKTNLYILYAKEGIWSLGVMNPFSRHSKDETTISITLEGCPKKCSNHGTCRSSIDGNGLTFYSYCSCDRDHGGFDCSIELVTHRGHFWQSVALIASNAAAILPAFWSLRQKAFAEWVLFTSSGLSSGLYHACDVGTWCVLSFRVLQFMDFWLSFMAVVSTFVYMATIDEKSKRALQTVVTILTALMAATGATRSLNIILIIAIGILGLLVAWLIEFSSTDRYRFCLSGCQISIPERIRRDAIMEWLWNLVKKVQKRFRWRFIFLGFIALAAAGISWKLETSQSYWIWHSLWHITIYTSSFLFLCSTSVGCCNQQNPNQVYELARQNSSSRGEIVTENGRFSSINGERRHAHTINGER